MLFHPLGHVEPAALASLGTLAALTALGAFHGLNPAMGWLFALALGLQKGSGWAIPRALVFITTGHALSLVVVAAVLLLAGSFIPLDWVRLFSGGVLLAYGAYKLVRYYRHPRWVGMQVGPRDLIAWSFLMATSHGAGLMLAPIILNVQGDDATSTVADLSHHSDLLDLSDTSVVWGIGLGVHTAAMLLVMLLIAVVVYKKVGLAFLRRGWINLDLLWAFALLAAGGVSILLVAI